MIAPRELKVAIVGAGNITGLRHIPALKKTPNVKVVGVVDRNIEKAKAMARRFGIANFGASMEARWFGEVDAVTIGVPPNAHFQAAKDALQRDKHVLLEKPMAMSLEEADELIRLSNDRSRVLAIVQNFQFARSALKLKDLIQRGRLGSVTGILCFQTSTADRRLPEWHEELPLGLFYDEAPHLLYLLQAFGGQVALTDVHVVPSSRGKVTPAVITAHFDAGGIPAVLYNNFEAPVSEWHFTVFGSKGVGVIDVFRDILVVLPHDGQHLGLEVLRTTLFGVVGHLWGTIVSGVRMLRGNLLYGNEEVFLRFVTAVREGGVPVGISSADGREVLRLQLQIVSAAGLK